MKALLYTILISFWCLTSCKEETNTPNDLDELHLNGEVKSISEFSYLVNGDSYKPIILKINSSGTDNGIKYFNINGQLTRSLIFNEDSIKYREILYEYRSNGDKQEIQTFDENGRLLKREVFKYDPNNNLVEQAKFGSGGELETKIQIEYDQLNRKVLSKQFEYNGGINTTTTFEYDDENRLTEVTDHYSSLVNLFYKKKYLYNDEGRKIKEYSFSDDDLTSTTTYLYNPQGKLIQETRLGPNNDLQMQSNYFYSHGRLIEEVTKDDRGGIFEINNHSRKYDSLGNQIQLISYNTGWSEVRGIREFKLKYDTKGNWITEITSKNNKVTTMTIRKIEYY